MSKKAHKNPRILEINISGTPRDKLLALNLSKIKKDDKFTIFTPNAEIILKSVEDKGFRRTLNSADFSLPDSVSVVMAHKFNSLPATSSSLRYIRYLGQGLRVGLAALFAKDWLYQDLEVIKGREYFLDLIQLAHKNKLKVFLLGGGEGVAEAATKELARKHKGLRIDYSGGPMLDKNVQPVAEDDVKLQTDTITIVNKFGPHILFVAFGAPKQELWITKNLPKLDVNLAMVVGGAFDIVSGAVKPPPSVFSKLGLEWLWRFLISPRRIGRTLNAFVVFPWKVYIAKIRS